jgi:hypothetical protein
MIFSLAIITEFYFAGRFLYGKIVSDLAETSGLIKPNP